MNNNKMTRKDLVLKLLMENLNTWIEGPSIASPEVGGSEGLKRVRELRDEGHHIETKKHPDKNRDIWLYRLVGEAARTGIWTCSRCGDHSATRPVEGNKKSIVDTIVMASCWKCRKTTVWQLKSR